MSRGCKKKSGCIEVCNKMTPLLTCFNTSGDIFAKRVWFQSPFFNLFSYDISSGKWLSCKQPMSLVYPPVGGVTVHPCFIVHIAFKAVFELTFLLQYESFFTKMQTRESKMPLKSRLLLFLGLGGVDSKLRAMTSDFTMGSPYCHSTLSWIQQ